MTEQEVRRYLRQMKDESSEQAFRGFYDLTYDRLSVSHIIMSSVKSGHRKLYWMSLCVFGTSVKSYRK